MLSDNGVEIVHEVPNFSKSEPAATGQAISSIVGQAGT